MLVSIVKKKLLFFLLYIHYLLIFYCKNVLTHVI